MRIKMHRNDILDWVKTEYDTDAEYLWLKYPSYAVLRNKDNKWYGIIMDVSKRKFGLESDEKVDVLNLKADTMTIDMLIGEPGFYRAYHMNKAHWISVFLDNTVPDDIIKTMLANSYEMTSKKSKRK